MFAYCGNDPAIFSDATGTRRTKDPVAAIDIGDSGLEGDGTALCFAGGWGNDGTSSSAIQTSLYTTSLSEDACGTTYFSDPSYSYCSYYIDYGYDDVTQLLQNCADIANAAILGNGHVVGTLKHTIFGKSMTNLGNSSLRVEKSYMGGVEVSHGTKGSIRFDVVLVGPDDLPICAWDFKTGTARLTEARIRAMLEKSGLDIPIFEVR